MASSTLLRWMLAYVILMFHDVSGPPSCRIFRRSAFGRMHAQPVRPTPPAPDYDGRVLRLTWEPGSWSHRIWRYSSRDWSSQSGIQIRGMREVTAAGSRVWSNSQASVHLDCRAPARRGPNERSEPTWGRSKTGPVVAHRAL